MEGEAKQALQKIRQTLAEEGEELTPDQVVESIKDINEISLSATGMSLSEGLRLSSFYSDTPPPPPYNGWFDDEGEAKAFAKRAEAAHGTPLSVMPIADKRFVIV